MKETLETMGASILVGGLSTFLGVIPLAFSTSAILRTVFTAFFAMVTLGLTHGLILLPVVLSLVGPLVCIQPHNNQNEKPTDLDDLQLEQNFTHETAGMAASSVVGSQTSDIDAHSISSDPGSATDEGDEAKELVKVRIVRGPDVPCMMDCTDVVEC